MQLIWGGGGGGVENKAKGKSTHCLAKGSADAYTPRVPL